MYPGEMTLSEYLSADDFDADLPGGSHGGTQVIPEGSRNATMSRFAGRVIKKYGDCEEAFNCFMEEADKCTPPLEQQELMTIWHSAQKFYAKVQQQDGYVPPELYNDDTSYKPDDFSDVGQAEVLAKHFSGELRYSPATHYIRYNGRYWQETEPGAQAVAHEMTRRQMREASNDMLSALAALKACGAQEILDNNSKTKAEGMMNDEQLEAYRAFLAARAYQSYVIQRRASKNITATLKESRPMLEITPQDLDANPFLLCTPDATYDLRLGMAGAREHSPEDFITKTTTVSPGDRGKVVSGGHEFAEAFRKSYGYAGREFVRKLLEPGNLEKSRTIYSCYFELLNNSSTTDKQAMAAALIVTADTLATMWIFKDGSGLTCEELAKFLASREAVSTGLRGYEYLCDWVSTNLNRFDTPAGDVPQGDILGKIDGDDVYIIATRFSAALEDGGFDPQAVRSYMASNGLLRLSSEKKKTVPKRIHGVLTRCICMRMGGCQEVQDPFTGEQVTFP